MYDVHTTQNHLQREQPNQSCCLPSFVYGDALQLIDRNIMWEWCQRAPYIEIWNSWSVTALSESFKQMNCLWQIRCKPEPPGWCPVLMPAALAGTPGPRGSSPLLQHPTEWHGAKKEKIHSATFINTSHYLNLGKVAWMNAKLRTW